MIETAAHLADHVFPRLPHPASGIDEPAIAAVQAKVRRGSCRASCAAVRIEAADRPGRERLLRYCARPAAAH